MLPLMTACASEGKAGEASYAGRAAFTEVTVADACKPAAVAPILVALLPVLVNQGLSFLQKMAADKAASYEASVSASTANIFWVNCGTTPTPDLQPRVSGVRFGYGPVSGTASADIAVRYKTLGFTGKPKLYVEGRFDYVEAKAPGAAAANKTNVATSYARFVPTTLEYNETLAKSGTQKDVLVTLSFNFPSAYQAATAKQSGTTSSESGTTPVADATNSSGATSGNKNGDAAKGGGDAAKGGAKPVPKNPSKSSSTSSSTSTTATVSGTTQTVVLPVFENMVHGRAITLDTVTTGWFALPQEQPGLTIDHGQVTLPVNLSIVVKETDAGHGAAIWLAVSDAISSNSSSIASAILGKSQSTSSKASPTTEATQ